MFKSFFAVLLCGILSNASALRITARQNGPSEADRRAVSKKLFQHPVLIKTLKNKDYRIIDSSLTDRKYSSGTDYVFHIFNYTDEKMLSITGPTDFSTDPKIKSTNEEIPASPEEFADAVNLLKKKSHFARGMRSGDLTAYEPMPSILADPKTFNGIGGSRLIGVGVRSQTDDSIHEIIGVNLYNKSILRFSKKAPPTSLATRAVCGLPSAGQSVTAKGNSGSAEIDISDDQGPLWNFIVVRPSASSGSKGSGLEIKNLYYKGKLVLSRAHTPILNVQYTGNACGPYRDWAYAENYFSAAGYNIAPGIRIATQLPTTIFDTANDYGNFRGVAIYQTEDKVTLVTEFSAGWYRYASKFELYNDGTIRPLFQFSAVRNSCVCYAHNHHVYWRFDFDINGQANSVQVYNGLTFRSITQETSFLRNSENSFWRVSSSDNLIKYDVFPGDLDGSADSYGIADGWLLRYKSTQIDDSSVRTSTRAALNSFVTGESLVNADLVFWYAGHYYHSHDGAIPAEGEVGPYIRPVPLQ